MTLLAGAAERGRRVLSAGILVFRWAALAWMTVLALTSDPFRRPELAWAMIGAAGGWTAWLTVPRRERAREAMMWFDLALAAAMAIASGAVVARGEVVAGRPFFATAYPAAAALAWGAARGVGGGLLAGAVLGAALALSRPVNGVAFGALTVSQVQSLANGAVNFLLAGGAVGVVSRLLDRSAAEFARASEEATRARERAARLAERDSLARQIHDSVLQALALVHKRGRDMAAAGPAAPEEVGRLAELAGEQEAALRNLILREPEEPPAGRFSLRSLLEAVALDTRDVVVSISSVGPVWMPAGRGEEVAAAVREALANVAEHARATKASVFAEEDGDAVVVTVRDDGVGFIYDEAQLRRERKAGMLKSMKGRIEHLGGEMRVATAPGRGTEIELRVPGRGEGGA